MYNPHANGNPPKRPRSSTEASNFSEGRIWDTQLVSTPNFTQGSSAGLSSEGEDGALRQPVQLALSLPTANGVSNADPDPSSQLADFPIVISSANSNANEESGLPGESSGDGGADVPQRSEYKRLIDLGITPSVFVESDLSNLARVFFARLCLDKLGKNAVHIDTMSLRLKTPLVRTMLNFDGFHTTFSYSDMSVMAVHESRLNGLMKADLTEMCRMLDLPVSGRKSDQVQRILDFMDNPGNPHPGTRQLGTRGHSAINKVNNSPEKHVESRGPELNTTSNEQQTYSMPIYENSRPKRYTPRNGLKDEIARSAAGFTRGSKQPNRKKVISTGLGSAFDSRIADFNPNNPESPFYVNHGPPLGKTKYTFVLSSHLDHAEADYQFSFPTPKPVTFDGYETQVHLRCLEVDVTKSPTEWTQQWPFPVLARVNGFHVVLDQARRYTNGKLAGVDMATNIQEYLRTQSSVYSENTNMNLVILKRYGKATPSSGPVKAYLLFAQRVLVKTTDLVVQEVKKATEKFWNDRLNANAEPGLTEVQVQERDVKSFMNAEGVVTDSLKISLRCPLAFTRIDVPVIGEKCQHIQCFDLKNYLEYSRKSQKFECPVCNQRTANLKDLIISPFFKEALQRFPDTVDLEVTSEAKLRLPEEKKTVSRTAEKSIGQPSHEEEVGLPEVRAKIEPLPDLSGTIIDLTGDDDSVERGGETEWPSAYEQWNGDSSATDGQTSNYMGNYYPSTLVAQRSVLPDVAGGLLGLSGVPEQDIIYDQNNNSSTYTNSSMRNYTMEDDVIVLSD
ncbi:hypothetical protein NDN08_000455 [Rhodosorus marinus]|uniref:SP-RING-type domain-containing protein n=1 Tax=Rhodosorus marinus TaxID=101924 RepID=A0AAV8UPH7_9RHOD|nr:hypothetical protein NDN08_000455 [Rhodosorus marinus]